MEGVFGSIVQIGPFWTNQQTGLKIMKKFTTLALATLLLVSPAVSVAGQTAPTPLPGSAQKEVQLKNIQLKAGGILSGQYVTTAGKPVAGVKIGVKSGEATQQVQTDSKGRFELKGLKGGRTFFQIGEEVYAAQLWANGTAPPNAISSLALVKEDGSELVRGQGNQGFGSRIRSLSPRGKALLGVAAIGAAATAIAIAADNDDDAS